MIEDRKAAALNYSRVQISTADRGRLLLMMYDGGIKFLRQAREGLEKKDIPKFARFLSKGQAIIAELTNTLDFEKGGPIARDLDRLYDFMLYYLTEANIQKDPAKISRVIELLEVVGGAFREVIEKNTPERLQELVDEAARKHLSTAPDIPAQRPASPEYRPFRASL